MSLLLFYKPHFRDHGVEYQPPPPKPKRKKKRVFKVVYARKSQETAEEFDYKQYQTDLLLHARARELAERQEEEEMFLLQLLFDVQ